MSSILISFIKCFKYAGKLTILQILLFPVHWIFFSVVMAITWIAFQHPLSLNLKLLLGIISLMRIILFKLIVASMKFQLTWVWISRENFIEINVQSEASIKITKYLWSEFFGKAKLCWWKFLWAHNFLRNLTIN